MSDKKFKDIGLEIEQKLESILKGIGGSRGNITINTFDEEISGEDIWQEAIGNPWKPFIVDGQFVVRYIKDHSWYSKQRHDNEIKDSAHDCYLAGNKVHFCGCKTIQDMKEKGRKSRYRQAALKDERRLIDLSNAENVYTKLAWCQNCVGWLFGWRTIDKEQKKMVSVYGNSTDILQCIKLRDKGRLKGEDRQAIRVILQKITKKEGITV